jgi:hypothetical protein
MQPTRYDVIRAGPYVQDQIRVRPEIVSTPALRWSWLSVENRALLIKYSSPIVSSRQSGLRVRSNVGDELGQIDVARTRGSWW